MFHRKALPHKLLGRLLLQGRNAWALLVRRLLTYGFKTTENLWQGYKNSSFLPKPAPLIMLLAILILSGIQPHLFANVSI